MALLTYREFEYDGFPGIYSRRFWNDVTKAAYENTVISGGSTVIYPDNTIIDVYQKSNNEVAVIVYSSLFFQDVGLIDEGHYGLKRTIIPGNNILLFKNCNTELSPPTFEYGVFNTSTKEVTIYVYPLSIFPFCSPFSISEDTILHQGCIGTTLRRYYYDGEDDVTIVEEINSATCGYVAPVPDVVVTEVKRIKIDHTCYKNPVYLVWKNSLMGWDHWLFYNTQTENLTSEDLGSFVQPIYDLESAEGTSNSLGKSAVNTMILGSNNLTPNQKDAIKDLLLSPQIYQVYTDGTKRVVKIKPGSLSCETRNDLHFIELEIELPETFTAKS